jgi:hypothetical protein
MFNTFAVLFKKDCFFVDRAAFARKSQANRTGFNIDIQEDILRGKGNLIFCYDIESIIADVAQLARAADL